LPFEGGLEDLYRLNLHLRVASRVLVRLGDFYAAAFSELHKKSGRLEWERYLHPGQPVRIHVTCHKSRLYHTGAVAQRVGAGIANRLGQPSPVFKGAEEDASPVQLVVVRLVRDRCTISIDSSGELLHRRGYRLKGAKAPLRETLAAALLLAAGWDPAAPLLDPFCGSGTIAIEAAQIALGLPPGRNRRFAFMDWPGYDPQRWEKVLQAGLKGVREIRPIIQASDRDAGAIQTAQENASRAGVAGAIELSQRALSAVQPPSAPGWVVTNPPYGVRVSHEKDLRDLYAQLGNVLRRSCPGWQVAVLGSDPVLFGQVGLRLETILTTINGGLSVRLVRGSVPKT
jgi:putative N6-adenine-specific DNA methylase